MKILPINLDDLIHQRSVESVRIEFKRTWSDETLGQIIRTICAFANDFHNLNGGYIILGIDAPDGHVILPPHGIVEEDLETLQNQIRGQCNRIDPIYQPVISPEFYQGKHIIVIWAPAGDVKPYQAPEKKESTHNERYYYVRIGASTVKATGNILTELMQMTAKVPFDDRRNNSVTIDMLSSTLVRGFLANIKSDLVAPGLNIEDRDLYRALRITAPVNNHEVPKNVALLFFVNDPERFFPGAKIEIVQFGDEAGGDLIEEKILHGPVDFQIRQTLEYSNTFSTKLIQKIPGQAETRNTVAFPYEAMEEAIVNSFYHRSYESSEPVKVYLYPDRMEIINYPGPVAGIESRHFHPPASIPPVPNRNRRIGEFLKDLKLAEGRNTGIPKILRKMSENGSPAPTFEFDEARTYFRVILPAHPQYVVMHALRESARLWAIGERQQAIAHLETALKRIPSSGALFAQIIEYKASSGDFLSAEELFRKLAEDPNLADRHLPYLAIAKAYLNEHNPKKASEVLTKVPPSPYIDDLIELAVLYKRMRRFQDAHKIFADNYERIKDDPKAIHEYAQTKIKLASRIPGVKSKVTKIYLNREAVELLRRVIQLSNDRVRSAWCWFDLAKTLDWLRSPEIEVLQAYRKAVEILPDEPVFAEWHQNRKGTKT